MERSRRNQQSEDKRSTSLLIQQLAAARERKLQGYSTAKSNMNQLGDSEQDSADSDVSDEGVDAAESPTASYSIPPGNKGHVMYTQRSRLFGRTQQKAATSNTAPDSDEVDDLADMIQGFGLSAPTSAAEPKQQQKQYLFPSSCSKVSTNSNGNTYTHSSNVSSTHRQLNKQPGTTAVDLTDSDEASSDDCSPTAAAPTANSAAASATHDGSGEDDDNSYTTHIPCSRKPAAAAAPAAAAGPHQQSSNSRGNTAHYCGASSDDDSCDEAAPASSQHITSNRYGSKPSSKPNSSSSSGDGDSSIRSYMEKKPAAAAVEPAEGSLVLEGGFCIDAKVAGKLYPHQVHGVKWLWSLHK